LAAFIAQPSAAEAGSLRTAPADDPLEPEHAVEAG
jgi:hypothetical protein